MENPQINVLSLAKGEERYVFTYYDRHRYSLICLFGQYASRPDLSFDWHDAAALAGKVNKGPVNLKLVRHDRKGERL